MIAAFTRDFKGSEKGRGTASLALCIELVLAALGSFNYRRIVSHVLDLRSTGYVIQERENAEWRSCRENGYVTLQLFTKILDRKATFPKR